MRTKVRNIEKSREHWTLFLDLDVWNSSTHWNHKKMQPEVDKYLIFFEHVWFKCIVNIYKQFIFIYEKIISGIFQPEIWWNSISGTRTRICNSGSGLTKKYIPVPVTRTGILFGHIRFPFSILITPFHLCCQINWCQTKIKTHTHTKKSKHLLNNPKEKLKREKNQLPSPE